MPHGRNLARERGNTEAKVRGRMTTLEREKVEIHLGRHRRTTMHLTTAKVKAISPRETPKVTEKVQKVENLTAREKERAKETAEEEEGTASRMTPEGAAQIPQGKDWAGTNPPGSPRAINANR